MKSGLLGSTTTQLRGIFGRFPDMLIHVEPPSSLLKIFCAFTNPALITYKFPGFPGETARCPSTLPLSGPVLIGVTTEFPAKLMLFSRNSAVAVLRPPVKYALVGSLGIGAINRMTLLI